MKGPVLHMRGGNVPRGAQPKKKETPERAHIHYCAVLYQGILHVTHNGPSNLSLSRQQTRPMQPAPCAAKLRHMQTHHTNDNALTHTHTHIHKHTRANRKQPDQTQKQQSNMYAAVTFRQPRRRSVLHFLRATTHRFHKTSTEANIQRAHAWLMSVMAVPGTLLLHCKLCSKCFGSLSDIASSAGGSSSHVGYCIDNVRMVGSCSVDQAAHFAEIFRFRRLERSPVQYRSACAPATVAVGRVKSDRSPRPFVPASRQSSRRDKRFCTRARNGFAQSENLPTQAPPTTHRLL